MHQLALSPDTQTWLSLALSKDLEAKARATIEQLIDARIPNNWTQGLINAENYWRAHGRLPGVRSDDDVANKILHWLRHQSKRYRSGLMPAAQLDAVRASSPVIAASILGKNAPLSKCQLRLREVNSFVEKSGRLPRQSSEPSDYNWLLNTSTKHRRGQLSEADVAAFSEAHPLIKRRVLGEVQRGRSWDDQLAAVERYAADMG